MKNIFRKIKLNDLGFYDGKDYDKELLKSIKYYFIDVEEFKSINYSDYIFYFKNKICIYSFHIEYKIFYFSDYIEEYFHKYKNGIDIKNLLSDEIGKVSWVTVDMKYINDEYHTKNKA